jgi:hypothetical protein
MQQEKYHRDIEFHIKALTLIIAVGTVIFSTMLLIGGAVLLPAVFWAASGEMRGGGPPEALILGLGLSAAYGLYKRRPWGRVLALIDCSISLFSFPVGTIVGAYGLWVLLPGDAALYLGGGERHFPGNSFVS